MLKKYSSILAVLLVLISSASYAEINIAVIDTNYIMAKVPQKDAINQKLKNEFSGREDELKRMGEEIEKERQDYIKNAATMSESQATEKKRSIQKKISDFQLKEAAFKEDVEKRSRDEQQKLGLQIRSAVEAVAKKGSYNMLVDRQAAPYIDASVPDVTDQVLAELSK